MAFCVISSLPSRINERCRRTFYNGRADMAVDSSLPDFRKNAGFWKAYPPIVNLGKSFSEMADPV
jgi:NAD-dependent SIR2 family protein deacetylase